MRIAVEKTDRAGYDGYYKENLSGLSDITDCDQYVRAYEEARIGPYFRSGNTKGLVRGAAVDRLISAAGQLGLPAAGTNILDAGFGQGELSVYLACRGFNVVGVDISSEAKECGDYLAAKLGVQQRCSFLAESLEDTSIEDASIDFVIGHASLHHFIKYEGVPGELHRVLKDGGKGFFADSFGENRLYHLFHDKEEMRRLGDVTLTKSLIESYFEGFDLTITPTDWFVMFDKLLLKVLPKRWNPLVRKVSRLNNWIDRRIPSSSRLALFLSGAVLTEITKRPEQVDPVSTTLDSIA
jgi:ubiquinone/menaquinone biosynthesis C-methylase UbiE